MSDEPTNQDERGGAKDKAPRVVPLPLIPTKRKLSESHLANLRASGLRDDTIDLAALYTEERPKALAELVQRRSWNRLQGAALVFPFYHPTNEGELLAVRVRPTVPLVETAKSGKKRARKYDQAEAHGLLVYFTPRARVGGWYSNPSTPLYWTEGEKKALVFDQEELCCVGLTGVWNWIDTHHKLKSGGEERLHPLLREHVSLAGRHHVIVFDADARQNDQVMMAAQRLAGVILAAGGASVRFVCPPDVTDAKGIDDYYAAHGGPATAALLESAQPIDPLDPKEPLVTVRRCKLYRDAPLPELLRVPSGYELQRDGSLWRTNGDERQSDRQVTHSPMFVTRVLVDRYNGEERVDLSWLRGEVWQSLCASRKAVVDCRAMVAELGPVGAPVTSGVSPKLVDWIEAFAHTNAGIIPRVSSVSTTGWHRIDGERVFVSHEPIGTSTVALDTRGDRRAIFHALTPRGGLDLHVQALKRAWDSSPLCAMMIAGALAAPLLEPLRAPNFAIHLVGESSRGKTSMLKIGASVFGDPAAPAWLASWNATMSGAEARASILTDLPQCYDEIGGGDSQQAERMLYALINGGGRTRATRDMSARETTSWRTVVLSTGEREMADESTATGAQVRVIQLPVEGFGSLSASEVDSLRAECGANSGQLGKAWLHELVEIDDWPHYRDAMASVTARLREMSADPLQARVAGYFGLLALVEAMVGESFGIGRKHTFTDLFAALGKREAVQGIAERGREAVESWVMAEPDAFPELPVGPHGGLDMPKSNGVRTRHGFRRPDGTLLLIPSEFRAFTKKSRLSARAVIREWERVGWTEVDAGRLDKLVRIGPTRNRYILLTAIANTEGSP